MLDLDVTLSECRVFESIIFNEILDSVFNLVTASLYFLRNKYILIRCGLHIKHRRGNVFSANPKFISYVVF